jgi:hypothetical protein
MQLLDLDFTTPVTQPFPASAAAMTALGLPAPTSIWTLNEAAGNAIDQVGANDLTPVAGIFQDQRAVGLWDGTDLFSKGAVETVQGGTQALYAVNNTVFDLDANTSFAFLMVFRGMSTGNRSMMGKRAGAPNFEGYALLINAGGSVSINLDDGPGAGVATVAVDHGDYAWHCALFVIDRNANNLGLWTDCGADAVNNIAGLGSLTNATIFALGQQLFVAPHLQIAYAAAWLGVNAQGMGAADLANFWIHASDPTGLLTTATHASLLSDVVGDQAGGLGELIGEFSTNSVADQIPISYNVALTNANSMGLRCQPARTTLMTDSDDFTAAGWVPNNAAVNGLALNDSPRGMREAQSLAATAGNGYVQDLFVSLASTVYTFDIFVKRHSTMGGDVAGALIMYDNTGAAIIATQAFVATTEWQRVRLRATTAVGQISTGFRIRVDVNGEALSIFRATAVQGEATVPIFASGGAATVALTDFDVVGVDGQYIRGGQGEIEAVAVCDAALATADRVLMEARNGVAFADARLFRIDSTERLFTRPYNSAAGNLGTILSAISTWNVERICRMQWNAVTAPPLAAPNFLANILDGVVVSGIAAGWVALNQAETIAVGQSGAAGPLLQLDGLIATLRIWDGTRPL